MFDLTSSIKLFEYIADHPYEKMKEYKEQGRKMIGVMPYFCPEELVYAAGMIPFGVWGADMKTEQSRRYYPAFICSILHTALEMGINGMLDDLSAIMIPISCDSLKGMGANWEAGVKNVPVINVAYAENRKIRAGIEFTMSQFKKIKKQLEEISGCEITDSAVADAIRVYNENRAALDAFTKAAGMHPEVIGAAARGAVIKAGYFMDRACHTKMVNELTAYLETLPASEKKMIRVVTTGILADSKELLSIFEENNIAIVGDQIAYESVNNTLTPVTDDPLEGMAMRIGDIEGCSVLYDLGKKRGTKLVQLAKDLNADGIIWVMTKFCDPEEYDYVPVRRMIDAAEIPFLSIDVDRQMVNYEQVRSAVQAFAEVRMS